MRPRGQVCTASVDVEREGQLVKVMGREGGEVNSLLAARAQQRAND